ncbi:trypsin-like serine peptidase [Actinokineospora sp. HUAS TT18]|uniref:trypsin-like serine peptidase n=1 Tax=Actinokineospora sp. HUAS TT18 TaxID=3447451 RepID=UPI003F51F534
MKRHLVLALAAAAALVLPAPASASPAAYWTPAAMRSAVPLDTLTVDARKVRHDIRAGAPQVVGPLAYPNGGSAWTGGGAVTRTVGRVFFTYQGRNASCSGNAVTSANKSTVMTAGHCVKLDGAYHTNWVFVPGYNNGNAPYGTWTARSTKVTPQWHASEDINYDVGTAVVNPLNGQLLTDVVGAQGIAFNQPKAQNMYAFGYPAAAPYDGSKLIYCSGRTFGAFLSSGIGMTCNMTGGSSGGPWFQTFTEGSATGIQNSVNSYKINLIPTWMFGPYFGADAQNLYNTTQAS